MSALSDYAEGKILDHIAGTTWTAPTNIYVRLHTATPGEAGTLGTIVAGNGTLRKEVDFAAASGGSIVSNNAQSWAAWDSGSVTLSHISLWDASTAGNAIAHGTLTAGVGVANADTFTIPVGSITVVLG